MHLVLSDRVGLLAAVKAPVRRPDGTWNIKLTVAAFRPWRGSPASIASDPTLNAALRVAPPHDCRHEEFRPAIADCGLQGTATSPSSTTKIFRVNSPPPDKRVRRPQPAVSVTRAAILEDPGKPSSYGSVTNRTRICRSRQPARIRRPATNPTRWPVFLVGYRLRPRPAKQLVNRRQV